MISYDILLCPSCVSGKILQNDTHCVCSLCGRSYKRIFNIIDFIGNDSQEDNQLVELILNNYEKTYSELINLKRNASRHSFSKKNLSIDEKLLERNREKKDIIFEMLGTQKCATFLELGCGIGSAIHGMAEIADYVIGVDFSMTSLLLANKILQERNCKNVLLVRASIDNLPLVDNLFDIVFSTDVIEHVTNQANFIRVGYNKVKPQGKFIFNSPNRYSVFSPEPHVGVWFVGFFPRKVMSAYVYFVKKMDYQGKRLLSYFELKRLIKKLGLHGEIKGLLKSDLEGASKNKLKCELLKRFPFGLSILNTVFKYFIPSYNVVIEKI